MPIAVAASVASAGPDGRRRGCPGSGAEPGISIGHNSALVFKPSPNLLDRYAHMRPRKSSFFETFIQYSRALLAGVAKKPTPPATNGVVDPGIHFLAVDRRHQRLPLTSTATWKGLLLCTITFNGVATGRLFLPPTTE